MRVCFIGDSFVNGTGDDDALGWVGRVVAMARRAGRDLTAYNLGVRRDTSADVADRWKDEATRRLPARHDGRLVFSFGVNDCTSGVDGSPRVSMVDSLAHAEAILVAASRWLPTLMIGPGTVADSAEANGRVIALSSGYAALCARLRVSYLEVCRLTLSCRVWADEAIAGDGAHPNRGGYSVLAQAVASWPAWQAWIAEGSIGKD